MRNVGSRVPFELLPPTAVLFWAFLLLTLFLRALPEAAALECFRNSALGVDIQQKVCDPIEQPYCVKANVYDGTVSRDCASARQCPQGDACAPITYTEDGTTDFVCCCSSNLCNSAIRAPPTSAFLHIVIVMGLFVTIWRNLYVFH